MNLDAFKKIYLPLREKLYRFSLRYVKDPMAAEDIVQEVYLRVWNKRVEMAELEKPEAYCMTMTRNLSLNYLKKRDSQHADLDAVAMPESHDRNADDEMIASENILRLREAIKTLTERQQLVIHLREVEEMTYDQIAELMEMSLAMVKSELFRARQHLKVKLEHYVRR
jgi:RNA polymerase sigma-70 factor (ECF subfamily)